MLRSRPEELLRPRKGEVLKIFNRKNEILTLFPPVGLVPADDPVLRDRAVRDNREAAVLIKDLRSRLLDDRHGDLAYWKLCRVGSFLDQRLQSIFEGPERHSREEL